MTITHRPSTNGHSSPHGAPPADADDGARAPSPADGRSRFGVRPGRLLLPVVLAVGVVLILRYFEQSTSG